MKLKKLDIYEILNSAGKKAIEVEVTTDNDIKAIASVPSAIIPGEREVNRTDIKNYDNNIYYKQLENKIINTNMTQSELDNVLQEYLKKLGSDICLAISLSFARVNAKEKKIPLVQYISQELKYETKYNIPKALVTVFSGGVHNLQGVKTLQNIMIIVNEDTFNKTEETILKIYGKIERKLKSKKILDGYGASSGMIVNKLTIVEKFELITRTINEMNLNSKVSLAVDVAAEHLLNEKTLLYDYEGSTINTEQLKSKLQEYINRYNITFMEDPFDSKDEKTWRLFKENNPKLYLVGDDIFATQSKFINDKIANGIVIKMNQAGTLTNTLETIKKAKELKMATCVSHRSIETEDTFMCDLSVAIDSEYIKIGGPRRGDRIIKYNRLKRLYRSKERELW